VGPDPGGFSLQAGANPQQAGAADRPVGRGPELNRAANRLEIGPENPLETWSGKPGRDVENRVTAPTMG